MSALDMDLRQVLIYFKDDENSPYYHHHMLVVQGPDGKWIGSSPTLEVQIGEVGWAGDAASARHAPPEHHPARRVLSTRSRETDERLRDECLNFAALLGNTQKVQRDTAAGS